MRHASDTSVASGRTGTLPIGGCLLRARADHNGGMLSGSVGASRSAATRVVRVHEIGASSAIGHSQSIQKSVSSLFPRLPASNAVVVSAFIRGRKRLPCVEGLTIDRELQ